MAPVVWFLVQHADGDVSVEPKVWEGWTKTSIMDLLHTAGPLFQPANTDKWKTVAILRVDEDEDWTIPF